LQGVKAPHEYFVTANYSNYSHKLGHMMKLKMSSPSPGVCNSIKY